MDTMLSTSNQIHDEDMQLRGIMTAPLLESNGEGDRDLVGPLLAETFRVGASATRAGSSRTEGVDSTALSPFVPDSTRGVEASTSPIPRVKVQETLSDVVITDHIRH
ncbi:hypothetical protein P43SY_001145 [Pythium insidiosum]|uniref:Uncharacterized protein n=1 Tax=Pythium insidiosum TaxID=114742 RepID=A0AAD5LVL5_PYTIN|nr:hypothetical protein P43SY_001145 [Pythium insidiosum]